MATGEEESFPEVQPAGAATRVVGTANGRNNLWETVSAA